MIKALDVQKRMAEAIDRARLNILTPDSAQFVILEAMLILLAAHTPQAESTRSAHYEPLWGAWHGPVTCTRMEFGDKDALLEIADVLKRRGYSLRNATDGDTEVLRSSDADSYYIVISKPRTEKQATTSMIEKSP